MSLEFIKKLDFPAHCLTNGEHQTHVSVVLKDGKLHGILLEQSVQPGSIDMDSDTDDAVYLPLDSLGEVGAIIYEALEVK